MDYRLNITSIRPTWTVCKSAFIVHIKETGYMDENKYQYILNTLKVWFGSASFFWYDHGKYSFLCGKK